MFGAAVGALNVYFKKENDLVPKLMFNEEGDQGNQWLHGIFNLPKSDKNFQVRRNGAKGETLTNFLLIFTSFLIRLQIIIEGVRGTNYVSDIAIDDVAILQGSKCRNVNKTETEGVTEGDEGNSCKWILFLERNRLERSLLVRLRVIF